MTDTKCTICNGNGIIELLGSKCSFCNGTGEPNKSAKSYFKSHTCQCLFLDRLRCPLCRRLCHHDTLNKSEILLSTE